MNRNYYLMIILLLTSVLTSCKKSDMEHESAFDKSYKAWIDFKKSSNNSYAYTVRTDSWVGTSSETTIAVWQGKIINRSYIRKVRHPQTNEIVVSEEWNEDSTNLNSHPNGSSALTLDEIYHKAKTEWLIKRKDADVSFETKNDGIISACGYVPKNCADDCFIGITITEITRIVD